MEDHDDDGTPDLMVKFDRQEVISLILRNYQLTDKRGTLTLTVTGKPKDGALFNGSDIIKYHALDAISVVSGYDASRNGVA